MSFLIAEILFLLALAAIMGGALVYWGVRRHFVDVSAEYERYEQTIREAHSLRRDRAEAGARIAALEAANAELERRLTDELGWRTQLGITVETLGGAVSELRPVDFAPLESRLDTIQGVVSKLQNTDVSPLAASLAATTAAVAAFKPADLQPLQTKLEALEAKVSATSTSVAGIRPTSLEPVEKKLATLDSRVAKLKNTDVSPVDARVRKLGETVRSLDKRLKPPQAADLSSVHKRLDRIEKTLKERPKVVTAPRVKKPATRKKAATPRRTARRKAAGALLSSASYGKADDLKSISGVGPKLEKMLNDIGVYYFFQVKSWKRADVERVDELLKVFKGRIERDQWVKQAATLAREPGSARMS